MLKLPTTPESITPLRQRHPESGSIPLVVSCRGGFAADTGGFFLLPFGSNGELLGSGSNGTGTPVLGAASAAADADGAERAGNRLVRTGQMDPEHRQCEF